MQRNSGADRVPAGPSAALRMTPVVLLADAAMAPVVRAGAARAGQDPSIAVVAVGGDARVSILAVAGTEVVVVTDGAPSLPGVAAWLGALGARPIPVLAAREATGVDAVSLALLEALPEGLNVAVPVVAGDPARARLWDSLRRAGAGDRHHLVEVDGRPALDELGSRPVPEDADRTGLLAAGAAGVLAGRLAAGNRRWAASLGPG